MSKAPTPSESAITNSAGVSKATLARYRQTQPYFDAFCSDRSLCGTAAGQFVTGEGSAAAPTTAVMIDFLEWMAAGATVPVTVKGKSRHVSNKIYDVAKKWLRFTVNNQLTAVKGTIVGAGWCGTLPGIVAFTRHVSAEHSVKQFTECTEADQRADVLISFEQQIRMSHAVLAGSVHKDVLQCLNGGFAFRGMMAMANRGENFRDVRLSFVTTREYPQCIAGETVVGLKMKNVRGKEQKGGNYVPTVTACFPHRNPLLCPIVTFGILLLHRFCVLKEQFPNVAAPASWCHLYLVRATSAVGGVGALSATAMTELFLRMFDAGAVECETGDAITHEPRHQAIEECQKAGVCDADVKRGSGHELTTHAKFYAVLPPTSFQLQRAGYDWANPECQPAHLQALAQRTADVDGLIDEALPQLSLQEKLHAVKTRDIAALPTREQRARARKDAKLRASGGMLSVMRWAMRVAIAGMSGRPRLADGSVALGEPPLYLQHSGSPVFKRLRVNGKPLFEHVIFVEVAAVTARLEADSTSLISPRTRQLAAASATATEAKLQPTLDAIRTDLACNLRRKQDVDQNELPLYALDSPPPNQMLLTSAVFSDVIVTTPAAAITVPPAPAAMQPIARPLQVDTTAAATAAIIVSAIVGSNAEFAVTAVDALSTLLASAEARNASLEIDMYAAALSAASLRAGSCKRKREPEVVELVALQQMKDVLTLWNRYVAVYRPCEIGGDAWRKGGNNATRWGEFGFIFRAIAQNWQLGEARAVQLVEAQLNAAGSWRQLLRKLMQIQPKGPIRESLKVRLLTLSPPPLGGLMSPALSVSIM